MKIRQGFVSNSSSSSFLLAIKESEECPHCGRSDPDIIDAIEQSGGGYSQTEIVVSARNKTDFIAHLEEELKGYEQDLEKAKNLDPSRLSLRYGITPEQQKKWRIEDAEMQCTTTRAMIEKIKATVADNCQLAEVKIGYNDTLLHDLLDNAIRAKTVEVIEET